MHKMARRQDRRKHGRGSGPGHVQQHTHLRPLTLREQRCLRTQRERGGCYRDAEERRSAAVRRHGAQHSTAQHSTDTLQHAAGHRAGGQRHSTARHGRPHCCRQGAWDTGVLVPPTAYCGSRCWHRETPMATCLTYAEMK